MSGSTAAQLTAADVDAALGDALDPDNPCAVWLRPADPAEPPGIALDRACREVGLHLSVVPEELGGRLMDLHQTMLAIRTAARRDLSVMPSTLISVTALAVALVAGDERAVTQVAEAIRAGETVGFAMSEASSGSDVLATTARLVDQDGGGYLLTGDKWLMGGGSRCRLAVVVAAHAERRGPGAFSAVLVELPTAMVAAPTPTLGMGRCEFTDLHLVDVPVPAEAVIGAPGRGLDLAMRAQQLVRVLSTVAPVAAMDTGLRLAVRHLDAALAAGRRISASPAVRDMVGSCAVELVLADVMTSTAGRLLQVAPHRSGLASAVVKHLAPLVARRQLLRATDLLGARSVLAEGEGAVLARMRADTEVVRYIDTSVAANLRTIDLYLSRYDTEHLAAADDAALDPVFAAGLFDAEATLPRLDLTRLALRPSADDPVLLGLGRACAEVEALLGEEDPALAALATWTGDKLRDALLSQAEYRAQSGRRGAAALPVAAITDLCWLWAAACCVHLWLHNRDRPVFGGSPGWTGWLADCLAYVRAQVRDPASPDAVDGPTHDEAVGSDTLGHVLDLVREGRPLGWRPEASLALCPEGVR